MLLTLKSFIVLFSYFYLLVVFSCKCIYKNIQIVYQKMYLFFFILLWGVFFLQKTKINGYKKETKENENKWIYKRKESCHPGKKLTKSTLTRTLSLRQQMMKLLPSGYKIVVCLPKLLLICLIKKHGSAFQYSQTLVTSCTPTFNIYNTLFPTRLVG